MKLLIKNGRVIDPSSHTDETLDILIDKKKIIDINPKINSKDAHIIDASNLVVAPGFIDMHTHLREPGFEDKETIETGALAAAKGGFTTIACMPNTSPVNDTRGITEFIISEAKKRAVVNVLPIAAITVGLKGEDLTEMSDLVSAGAVAFSDDGEPAFNSLIMRRALEYSKLLDTVIIDHCEDKNLSARGVMHEGYYSYLYGVDGISDSSEEVMVARDIILSEKADMGIHLAHISTKGSVDLIRTAKKKKLKITAEVTPHHLLLTDESLLNYDTNLKMSPPLRSKEDVRALLAAVKDGTIDIIATDHAPHTPDEKAVELDVAPFGIIGLETAVPLLLDKLVLKNIISLERFVQMMSVRPAEIFGLANKGKICAGADADLTILNLQKEIIIDTNTFKSKSRNCPFHGWKLKGKPEMTIVKGKIVSSG